MLSCVSTGCPNESATEDWPATVRLDQAEITVTCMVRYLQMADPDLLAPSRHSALLEVSARCEARPEFQATYPAEYALPRGV